MHKIGFTPITLPRGATLSYLLAIFIYHYVFDFSLYLEKHSIASHYFFTDVLGITQTVTSLKKPLCSISHLSRSHFEVF